MSSLKLFRLCNKSILQTASFNSSIASVKYKSSASCDDQITHTGQHWENDDYRLARFIDKPKQVNPNFAVKLIDEIVPKACKDRVVSCDGGGGPIGHPKVYINLDKPGNHACGYCGLRFYLDQKHH